MMAERPSEGQGFAAFWRKSLLRRTPHLRLPIRGLRGVTVMSGVGGGLVILLVGIAILVPWLQSTPWSDSVGPSAAPLMSSNKDAAPTPADKEPSRPSSPTATTPAV